MSFPVRFNGFLVELSRNRLYRDYTSAFGGRSTMVILGTRKVEGIRLGFFID